MIVEVAIRRRLLKFPAQTLLRLGHRRDRRELLQQRVPPKGTLDRQRRVSRFHPAVFSLQHLDLLVEQILRQLVSVWNKITQFFFNFRPRLRSLDTIFHPHANRYRVTACPLLVRGRKKEHIRLRLTRSAADTA